ncbi:MAG: 50S ribosomal protein L11 methyltransferase [Acidimicrobiales bacterium]
MGWILRTTVPSADSEALGALLWDLHATGLAEIARGDTALTGTDSGRSGASGAPPVAANPPGGPVDIVAGFATGPEAEAAADTVRRWIGPSGEAPADVAVAPADDRDWLDPDRTVTIDVGGHRLELRVGGAFGDGAHPSTRLALDLLASIVRPGAAVLDVGTGTGVLALGARALGAGPVVAVDTDPEARRVAMVNVTGARRLTRSVPIEVTGALPPPPTASPAPSAPPGQRRLWEWGGGELPPRRRFAVVVANLVLGEQRLVAPLIDPLVAPGGTLVLAGLLTSQEDEAVALHPGFEVVERRTSGDWSGLALRRAAASPPLSTGTAPP